MKSGSAVEFHQMLAREWEGKYARASFQSRDNVVEKLLSRVDVSGKYWLDAGCGSGRFSRLLALRGASVLGIDAAPEMIRVSQELAKREDCAGTMVNFRHVSTIESIDEGDGVFDGILCNSVLEYVEDPQRVLAEFARLLKPGGKLLISVPNRQSLFRRLLKLVLSITSLLGKPRPVWLQYSRNEYSIEEFSDKLARFGFFMNGNSLCFGGPLPKTLQSNCRFGSLVFFSAEFADGRVKDATMEKEFK